MFYKVSLISLRANDNGTSFTEVGVKSPGDAKTLRITLYAQNLGRFPKVGLGLVPGLFDAYLPSSPPKFTKVEYTNLFLRDRFPLPFHDGEHKPLECSVHPILQRIQTQL